MAAVVRPMRPEGIAVPRWTWALLAAAFAVLWLVTMESSLVSALAGTPNYLHELFHDARHLLGVPCH